MKTTIPSFKALLAGGLLSALCLAGFMVSQPSWAKDEQGMLKQLVDQQLKARISSVKANMHTLQTLVETYGVDWGGGYPSNMKSLKQEAVVVGREYWKEFTNPFSGVSGSGKSYMDYRTYKFYTIPQRSLAGMVLYQPLPPDPKSKEIVNYRIWGCDENGKLIQDKGQDFYLSNS